MAYRVDTVPGFLKPLILLYGYGLALPWLAYYAVQKLTVRIQVEGLEKLDREANYIFSQWHGTLPLTFQWIVPRLPRAVAARSHVWMQHPLCYMKPIHAFLYLVGVRKLVLGSTGHDGQDAANRLVQDLREGYSTWLVPDGPAGPARVLKTGILHIAAQSGVPIVPLRVRASRCVRSRSWDRRQHPVPFSTIRIGFGSPILVTEDALERAERQLYDELG